MSFVGAVLIAFIFFKLPDWIWEYRFSKKMKRFKLESDARVEQLKAAREKYLK